VQPALTEKTTACSAGLGLSHCEGSDSKTPLLAQVTVVNAAKLRGSNWHISTIHSEKQG